MKHLLIITLLLAFSSITFAQSLAPEVIATSGTSFNDGTSQLDWTLGESITNTLVAGSDMLTQGFHQPDLMVTEIGNTPVTYTVSVFPNPTASLVQVQFQELKEGTTIELYSVDGKLLESEKVIGLNTQLDLSKYKTGTYMLSVKNEQTITNTYRIIKSN